MLVVAPKNLVRTREIGGLTSLSLLRGEDMGSESDRGDAARVRDERYPPRRSRGRGDLGPRVVDPAVAQVAAHLTPRAEGSSHLPWGSQDASYTLVRSPKDVRRLICPRLASRVCW